MTASGAGHVSVLACSLALMVSVERDEQRRVRDIHLHAGGQGFWVARMAARLGADVTLVTALGGEPGVALEALVRAEGMALTAVESGSPNAVWVSDEEEGENATVAELPAPNLARHEADGLFNALIAAGLESDVTVLTGSPPASWRPSATPASRTTCTRSTAACSRTCRATSSPPLSMAGWTR